MGVKWGVMLRRNYSSFTPFFTSTAKGRLLPFLLLLIKLMNTLCEIRGEIEFRNSAAHFLISLLNQGLVSPLISHYKSTK